MAMQFLDDPKRFPLAHRTALCFFAYTLPLPELRYHAGQLFKSELKSHQPTVNSTRYTCDLKTLELFKHAGMCGEVEQPEVALSFNLYNEGYSGVLCDSERSIKERLKTTAEPILLLLSRKPPYEGPGTPRRVMWNMMLVKPVEDDFYERVAVGRFRGDLMLQHQLDWDYRYIRLA